MVAPKVDQIPKIDGDSWLDIESQRRRMGTDVAARSIAVQDAQQERLAKDARDYNRWFFSSSITRHPHAKKDPSSEGTS